MIKKVIAREFLLLILSAIICSSVYFGINIYNYINDQYSRDIEEKITQQKNKLETLRGIKIDGVRTFKLANKFYDIKYERVDTFLKIATSAKEYKSFRIDSTIIDIELKNVNSFKSKFPKAIPNFPDNLSLYQKLLDSIRTSEKNISKLDSERIINLNKNFTSEEQFSITLEVLKWLIGIIFITRWLCYSIIWSLKTLKS